MLYLCMQKVAEIRNTQVKYLKIKLKYSTWVNVLGYFPSLRMMIQKCNNMTLTVLHHEYFWNVKYILLTIFLYLQDFYL